MLTFKAKTLEGKEVGIEQLEEDVYDRQILLDACKRELDKKEAQQYIPYQCCPVCNGLGQVPSNGITSSCYDTCDVCNGDKIIPMHIIEYKVEEK